MCLHAICTNRRLHPQNLSFSLSIEACVKMQQSMLGDAGFCAKRYSLAPEAQADT